MLLKLVMIACIVQLEGRSTPLRPYNHVLKEQAGGVVGREVFAYLPLKYVMVKLIVMKVKMNQKKLAKAGCASMG
jgi:hypothetical protein